MMWVCQWDPKAEADLYGWAKPREGGGGIGGDWRSGGVEERWLEKNSQRSQGASGPVRHDSRLGEVGKEGNSRKVGSRTDPPVEPRIVGTWLAERAAAE